MLKKINLKGLRRIPQKFKVLSKRNKIIVCAVLIVLIGGGAYAIAAGGSDEVLQQAQSTAVVSKGDVKKIITATGTVSLTQVMPLSFEEGGTVQEIYVKAGDKVTAGQPLVQLDTTTLEQELKEAQENLASAQAGYGQTIGSLERKLKSSLVQAEKTLLDTKKNADPFYLQNQYYLAELNLRNASQNLANAQSSGETNTYQLQSALSQAQLNLKDAEFNRDGGAAKELEVAQAEYDAALKARQDFEKGVSNEYLAAKASLTQSETKFVTAQENLDEATLTAPMDGTIISSDVELYQNTGTATVMTLVADSKDFTVTASVDQADIGEIKTGQKADLTLDTNTDEIIAGTVSGVSLKGTNSQNVITYGITIKVDEPSTILRDQMSVNVSIITDEVSDVLIIPAQAMVTRGNRTGVLVSGGSKENGGFEFVSVEAGLNDGTNVEVKSGLSEGQTIILQGSMAVSGSTTETGQSRSGMGGLGGLAGPTGGGTPPGGGQSR